MTMRTDELLELARFDPRTAVDIRQAEIDQEVRGYVNTIEIKTNWGLTGTTDPTELQVRTVKGRLLGLSASDAWTAAMMNMEPDVYLRAVDAIESAIRAQGNRIMDAVSRDTFGDSAVYKPRAMEMLKERFTTMPPMHPNCRCTIADLGIA